MVDINVVNIYVFSSNSLNFSFTQLYACRLKLLSGVIWVAALQALPSTKLSIRAI